MSVRYEFDFEEVVKLEEKMARLPNKMEDVINNTLHGDGIERATKDITHLIPVSKPRKSRLLKRHARMSNWSKSEKDNLAFTVKSYGGAAKNRGSFGYLVFPNEGRGRSNPIEQRFMERGLESASPKILDRLNVNVDQTLQEELS